MKVLRMRREEDLAGMRGEPVTQRWEIGCCM